MGVLIRDNGCRMLNICQKYWKILLNGLFDQRHPSGCRTTDASLPLSQSKHKTHTFGGDQDDLILMI